MPNGEIVAKPPNAPSNKRLREYESFKTSRKLKASEVCGAGACGERACGAGACGALCAARGVRRA
eukprot:4731999-Prymnesium_polylepis.1